ncbi:MAG: isochorismate synthase [Acidimicrobiia bacterium]
MLPLEQVAGLPAPETLTLHRLSTDLDPLTVARAADPSERVAYFASGDVELAGLGVAWSAPSGVDGDRFHLADAELAEARLDPAAHLVVGFAFDPDRPGELWDGFPPLALELPELAVVRRESVTELVVALRPGRSGAEVAADWAHVTDPGPVRAHHPSELQIEADPPAARYLEAVAEAVDDIRSNGLTKVVLGRSLVIRSDTPARPFDLMAALAAEHPDAYRYALRRGEAAFVGATPELLVSLRDGLLASRPFAGTAPRGRNDAEDQALAGGLLASAKDRWEHRVMVDDIIVRLEALVPSISVSEPSVERLRYVQHLVTRITGSVPPGTTVLGLSAALHPTPAVGGVPADQALAMIDKLEGLDRGWYAGGVGWVDGAGNGEVAVALRCALLRGTSAHLFAGSGIVADSIPEAELDETTWKFRALLRHLGES